MCLQGELEEATFGPVNHHVDELPAGNRPQRELQCLAALVKTVEGTFGEAHRILDQSVAFTLCPSRKVSVQGGKIHSVDQKGIMRVTPQKRKGCLCLDGIFFSVSRGGEHIEPSEHTSDGTSFVRKPRVKSGGRGESEDKLPGL